MFGLDFFPTPRAVAKMMLKKVPKTATYFLEPSAGKGDLARAILQAGESAHYSHGSHQRHKIDVIEAQAELATILCAIDGLSFVGTDWLTYAGVSYYDAIVMNPPFSTGATHLLKAWDFLHAGDIVCLLNQETIRNPHTAERQQLMTVIEKHGTVEVLGPVFRAAERHTSVDVVLVHLTKTAEDDRIDLWHSDGPEREIQSDDNETGLPLALRDKLGNMEHYYTSALSAMFAAFSQIRKSSRFMEALGTNIRGASGGRDESDLGIILKLAGNNITAARAEFATALRRGAWMHIFEQVEFHKWLDSQQTESLLRDLERGSTIAFTAENIKGTLSNIFLQRKKLYEQSVWNVFVALTRHYKGNTTGDLGNGDGRSGWKSNDSFKVNAKLIFPYGCHYSYGGFDIWSMRQAGVVYVDLDRVVCVLDGQRLDTITTVMQALEMAFRSRQPGTCESTYFHIRYFKKGTVHLRWKRRDLLDRFNLIAASGRPWIGAATQEDDLLRRTQAH